MKRLLLVSLFALNTAPLFADVETNPEIFSETQTEEELLYDSLKQESAKGDIEASSRIIDQNPQLRTIKQKLDEKNWLEMEMRGINLRILLIDCEQGKNCKKYVKQVERLKLYKQILSQKNEQTVEDVLLKLNEQVEPVIDRCQKSYEAEITGQTDESVIN